MIPQPATSVFDDMTQCTDAMVERMLPLVPEWRREQALAFSHTFGRFACLKSFLMLKSLLYSEFNYNGSISFELNAHGKPSVAGYPDMQFSISHCRNAVAVAVWDRPVGIDVESFRKVSDSLMRRTMNDMEMERILKSGDPGIEFAALWTKKEAVFKLQGTGITDNLHDILSEPVRIETAINREKGYALSTAVSL